LGKTLYIQDKLHLKQSKNVVRLVENIQSLVAAIFINIEGDFIDKLANRLHGQAPVCLFIMFIEYTDYPKKATKIARADCDRMSHIRL
jgi:hypothetical protein